ncbi:MAG TPA: DinB family protein, partial [Gemmatimonadaceae bacterium]|nr:DinB family protein [Gemmatimonadaceae bacterium]
MTETAFAANATDAPARVLFPDVDNELSATRRVLERVPDGKDDWRPHAKSRSLGELATHVAQLPGFGIVQITQDEYDGANRRPEPSPANNAERLKIFDEVSGEFKRQLRQLTWERANAPWSLKIKGKTIIQAPRAQILRTVYFMHAAHHRAQLGVYLRMLEIPVPAVY